MNLNIPILIADDLESVRRVVRNCLHQLGLENISEATTAEEAITLSGEQQFALVITDWSLPSIDGAQLWQQLRLSANPPKLLMVAALAQRDEVARVSDTVNADYVIKPFTARILEQKINQLVGNAASA